MEYTARKTDVKYRKKKNKMQIGARTKQRKTAGPKGFGQATSISLSECLLAYAAASIDPFQEIGKDPCIPDALCTPSYKFNVKATGGITVGTSGIGYVLYNPWTMVVNDNASNATSIDYPIVVTTAEYDYTGFNQLPSDLGTKLSGINSNSQYTVDQFQSGANNLAQLRLVAAGVEVFYTGKLLDQSGAVTTLQNDGLNPFTGAESIPAIRNNPKAVTCATSKDSRCYVSYYPTNQDVLSYKPLSDYRPSEADALNYAPLLIICNTAEPGTSFQFQAKAYFEVLMPGMNATPSESDPIGFGAFQAARTQVKATQNPKDDLRTTLQHTIRNIATSVSGLAPSIGTAIGSIFGSPTAGAAFGTATQSMITALLGGQNSQL